MTTYFCPSCDYNLTGLKECRCPECGATFSIEQLEKDRVRARREMVFIAPLLLGAPFLNAIYILCCLWLLERFELTIPRILDELIGYSFILLLFAVPAISGWIISRFYTNLKHKMASTPKDKQGIWPVWINGVFFILIEVFLMFVYLYGCAMIYSVIFDV